MLQNIIEAYQASWRAAKTAYHIAAFVALILVGGSIATGHMNGYYQLTLPLGTAIGSVDSADVLPVAVAQNTSPVPQHKPRVTK